MLDCVNYWLCIFTQPHREKLALGSLQKLGLEVYLPIFSKSVLRSGKRVSVLVPLFSRYIFVTGFSDLGQIYQASRNQGVTGFASGSIETSFIHNDTIELIKSREDDRGLVVFDPKQRKSGDRVKIIDGPFVGFEALFLEPNNQKRCYILLSLMGKANKILINNDQIDIAV